MSRQKDLEQIGTKIALMRTFAWVILGVLVLGFLFSFAVLLLIIDLADAAVEVDPLGWAGIFFQALQAAGLFAIAIGTVLFALMRYHVDMFWRVWEIGKGEEPKSPDE